MNYGDKAEQLREERLEKERLAMQQQAKANEEAAERKRRLTELAKQKKDELLPLFKQFVGRKICNGHVTVDAEVTDDGKTVCLTADSVGSSVLDQYKPGALLLSAHYDPESQDYHLHRYENPPKVRGAWTVVGKYQSTADLMNAVAAEFSKL